MQGAVLQHCDRLLTMFHRRGLHAAVMAGLVMMPLVVMAGFVTDRPEPPRRPRLSIPALRGSLDPQERGPAAHGS